jgi:hypothetical protein
VDFDGIGLAQQILCAPTLEDQQGRAPVIDVVSWSTVPSNTDGCGGLTCVTALSLYRDWILLTARNWDSAL